MGNPNHVRFVFFSKTAESGPAPKIDILDAEEEELDDSIPAKVSRAIEESGTTFSPEFSAGLDVSRFLESGGAQIFVPGVKKFNAEEIKFLSQFENLLLEARDAEEIPESLAPNLTGLSAYSATVDLEKFPNLAAVSRKSIDRWIFFHRMEKLEKSTYLYKNGELVKKLGA
ncbi:hypothetical protein HN954_03285 [bacterium]|jgi:hypothetical protein|nr:hypothetical protein [bacterium]MBT6832127.1 hypothetical protein [bacterium]MBT6996427.1 hypothetical protein [bacterium]MBT7772162.1 hypothetical protein [bacterium]